MSALVAGQKRPARARVEQLGIRLELLGSVIFRVDRNRHQPAAPAPASPSSRRICAKVAVITGQIVVQVVKMKFSATGWPGSSSRIKRSLRSVTIAPDSSINCTSGIAYCSVLTE